MHLIVILYIVININAEIFIQNYVKKRLNLMLYLPLQIKQYIFTRYFVLKSNKQHRNTRK